MSISIITYVGPFFKCLKSQATQLELKPTCSNYKCLSYGTLMYENFCSICGSPIVSVEFPVIKPKVNVNELLFKMKERLYFESDIMPDYDIWLSNIKFEGKSFVINERQGVWEVNSIESEIESFENFFDAEYKLLIESYGQNNIEVKYGCVQAYH